MNGASPRLFWLMVHHGLRLYWRSWHGKRRSLATTLLVQVVLLGFLHVQMPIIFSRTAAVGGGRGGAELACSFAVLFILTAGLHRSLEVLYNRGDLPYLMSSPVAPRLIVLTRLVDVLATTALATLFLVMPMLNAAVYLFGTSWIWGWLAWLLGVLTFGTVALVLTVQLVSWIGARAARTLLQVLGIVVGTVAIAVMQAPTWLRQLQGRSDYADTARRYFAAFEVPPLSLLADAATGRPAALALLGGLAAACAWLGLRVLDRRFLDTVRQTATEPGTRRRRAADAAELRRSWQRAFRRGRWTALVAKELRTLRRDPLLLARSSTQLIAFLPAFATLLIMPRGAAVGTLGIIAATMTAMTTATLMTALDESLEFAASSPTSRRAMVWARAMAAAIPAAGLGWIAAGVLALLGAGEAALATGGLATFLALAVAWLGGCTTPRQTAEDRAENRRVRGTWQAFVAMFVGGCGAAAIASRAMGAPAAVPTILGTLTLLSGGAMFLVRPRPVWAA